MPKRPKTYKLSLSNRKKVWGKGHIIEGHPPDIWRRDAWGNIINWQEFGSKGSKYGWGIINQPTTNQIVENSFEQMEPAHLNIMNEESSMINT